MRGRFLFSGRKKKAPSGKDGAPVCPPGQPVRALLRSIAVRIVGMLVEPVRHAVAVAVAAAPAAALHHPVAVALDPVRGMVGVAVAFAQPGAPDPDVAAMAIFPKACGR